MNSKRMFEKGIYNWRYIAFARLTERTSKLYCSMMANTTSSMHIYRSHKINPFIWTHSIFFVFTYRLTQYCNSKSELLLAIMVLDILQTWTKIYITDACAWNVWLKHTGNDLMAIFYYHSSEFHCSFKQNAMKEGN